MGLINYLYEGLKSMIMGFENIASYEEKELTQEDELRKSWEEEYWHYTDEQIDIELRKYNYYNYCIKYDGRRICVEKLIEHNVKHGYKVI